MVSRGVVPLEGGCGGAELVAFQLAKAMAVDGHQVTLITDAVGADLPDVPGVELSPIGSRVLELVERLPGGFPRWLLQHFVGNVTATRSALRFARRRQFDLVHAHGALSAMLLTRRLTLPVVYTEHDSSPWMCRYRRWWERVIRKAIYRGLNGMAFRRADLVAATCADLRHEIVVRFGVPSERVVTILNGTDLELFRRESPGASLARERAGFDRYCLFVGRLTPRKAPDLLLRAVASVDDVCCAIVGDGPMRRKLEALVRAFGLEERVVLLGNLAPAELGRIYADADFLVLPSVSETTPLVMLEAMSCGTPVLGTRVAGIRHVIRHGENGLLVEPDSVDELAAAIERLAGDQELCARMGETAEQYARAGFLWPMLARQYVALYENVALEAPALWQPLEAPVASLS